MFPVNESETVPLSVREFTYRAKFVGVYEAVPPSDTEFVRFA